MSKRSFQRILPLVLLLGMLLTLAFIRRYEEPYPAIYQPAFQRTTTDTDRVYTQVAELTAWSVDGQRVAVQYEEIFAFAPDNRDVFLFRMIPDTVPEHSAVQKPTAGLKKFIITDYEALMKEKSVREYPNMLRYLEKRAEETTGRDIISLDFSLYDVTQDISTGHVERRLVATKQIKL